MGHNGKKPEKAASAYPLRRYRVIFRSGSDFIRRPWVAERWATLGRFINSHPGATISVTEHVLRSAEAKEYDATAVFTAIHALQHLTHKAKQLLADSVLILPTCGGTWTREQVRQNPIQTNSDMGRYTNHCNLLDLCAVALPAGFAAPNVPFGITLFTTAEQEGMLANLASHLTKESISETVEVAVCGLHMRGFPLEAQIRRMAPRSSEKRRLRQHTSL